MWVTVDTKERRIFIGVPMNAATSPNKIIVLDYRDLDTAEDISGRPPVNITNTGRKTATDRTRKWSPWTVAANSCAQIERADGTSIVVMGGGQPGIGGGSPTGKSTNSQRPTVRRRRPDRQLLHHTLFPRPRRRTIARPWRHPQTLQLPDYVRRRRRLASPDHFIDSQSAPQAQQSLP